MDRAKILIVEDTQQDFDSLKAVLQSKPYDLFHAKTGAEGFKMLKEVQPDLIILDILLPDTDGFEICKQIRKDDQFLSLPVLFYSVIRTIDDKLLGLEMGATDFLPKGADARELLIRIKNLLKRKRKLDDVINYPFQDKLTKTYSEKYFTHRLKKECERSRRYSRNLSFAIVNIDKFKMITGTFGLPTGDSIVQKVSEVVIDNTRLVDEICRMGPDEFGILFPETDLRYAFFAAERVRQVWKNGSMGKQICTVDVTVSCGVSTFTKDTLDVNDLITQTKAALTKAKEEGRDKTKSYSKQYGYG